MRFLFLLSICFNLLAAEKELYFLGGGGEPKDKTETIFDQDLKNVAKFAKKSEWKTAIAFNGGHIKTEKTLAQLSESFISQTNFSNQNYNSTIKTIKDKLITNQLKANDQLMVIIDTHGNKNNQNSEKSHRVYLSDGSANLDDLASIIALAEEKKVKLALIDLSCYSGNTLNLPHKNSCIISAAGSKHLAFTSAQSFSLNFTSNLHKGKNLEDIFLEAREADSTSMEFPMISTPEGATINAHLYEALSPYLLYSPNETESPLKYSFSPFDSSVSHTEKAICLRKESYTSLQNLINSLEAIFPNLSKLKLAIKKYQDFQMEYASALLQQKKLSKKLFNLIPRKDREKFYLLEKDSFLSIDYQSQIDKYNKLVSESLDPLQKKELFKIIKELNEKRMIRDSAISKLSSEDQIKFKTYSTLENKTPWELAYNVANEAKKLYTDYYAKIKSKESNPCRDFVL